MSFLQDRHHDRFRQGPEHIMRFPIEDHEPEHRDWVRGAVHLVSAGGAGWRDQLQLKHDICYRWIRDKLVSPPTLYCRIKLIVRTIRIAAEGMRKESAVGASIRDKDCFCIQKCGRHGR